MESKEESEEERLERLENEEFERTGSFSTSFKINIQITERDVIDQFLKDNKDLEPKNPNDN
jgi:hypothetical protein